METDLVWACPSCRAAMIPKKSVVLDSWHCTACHFDWVSGEALATFLPTVTAFEKLRSRAVAAQASMRSLNCPICRAHSLRLIRAAGVEIDVCPRCVSIALDPGELRTFKTLGAGAAKRTLDVFDVVTGAEAIVQMLGLFF
jgi:Zn-finger nucleic acid-binding protein